MSTRLGVIFSCPERPFGSQWTLFQFLVPELWKLNPDMVHFGATSVQTGLAGVSSIRIPASIVPASPVGTAWSLMKHQIIAAREIRRARCDILVVPFTHEMVRFVPKVRQLVVVHDLLPLVYPQWFSSMGKFWRYHLIPGLMRTHAVSVDTEATKRDLDRFMSIPKARVAVNALGFVPMTIKRSEKKGSVLYVSSSHLPHKNIPALIEAFALLAQDDPSLSLRVIGKKDPRFSPDTERLVSELGYSGRIRFDEALSKNELSDAYAEASVLAYPSLYEGFGLPPLEAMAAGVPVAASNTGAVAETCGNAAHYFDPSTPEAIAKAVGEVLRDPELRSNLQSKGFERCRQFSWATAAKGMLAQLRDEG